jgi:hypothetical protein
VEFTPTRHGLKTAFDLLKLWCAILGLNQSVRILRGSGRFLSRERLCGINSALLLTRGAYASFTSRFAITLLTACNSLKPNGPGLCTVPRRVRGEKTERQEYIPPKRPSSFRHYLGARHARHVPSAVGDSVHGCTDTAPANVKLLNGVSPGRDSGGRLVKPTPNFERGCPEPPVDLGAEALAEWERITPAWTGRIC